MHLSQPKADVAAESLGLQLPEILRKALQKRITRIFANAQVRTSSARFRRRIMDEFLPDDA